MDHTTPSQSGHGGGPVHLSVMLSVSSLSTTQPLPEPYVLALLCFSMLWLEGKMQTIFSFRRLLKSLNLEFVNAIFFLFQF